VVSQVGKALSGKGRGSAPRTEITPCGMAELGLFCVRQVDQLAALPLRGLATLQVAHKTQQATSRGLHEDQRNNSQCSNYFQKGKGAWKTFGGLAGQIKAGTR